VLRAGAVPAQTCFELAGEVLPVYRAAELRKLALLRSGPRAVRRVHEVKTILNGRITDVRKKQDQGR